MATKKNTKKTTKRTASKKSKSANATRTRKVEQSKKKKGINPFQAEMVSIFSLIICLILFVSNLGLGGSFGRVFRSVDLGLFGLIGYIFPIILLVAILVALYAKNRTHIQNKYLASTGIFISVCAIAAIFSGDKYEGTASLAEFYSSQTGGGFIGGVLASIVRAILGSFGAIIVFLGVMIVCCVYLTERSFVKEVRKKSKQVYSYAKESYRQKRYDQDQEGDQEQEDAQVYTQKRFSYNEAKHRNIGNADGVPSVKVSPRQGTRKTEVSEPTRREEQRESDQMVLKSRNQQTENAGIIDSKMGTNSRKGDDFSTTEDSLHRAQSRRKKEKTVRKREDFFPYRKKKNKIDRETLENVRDILKRKEELRAEFRAEEGKIPFEEDESDVEIQNIPVVDKENIINLAMDAERYAEDFEINSKKEEFAIDLSEEKSDLPATLFQEDHQDKQEKDGYHLPSVTLLDKGNKKSGRISEDEFQKTALRLEKTLHNFGVEVSVTDYSVGPVVTRYELRPEQGVKVSKIVALTDDIKLALAAKDIRIEAPIPGKAAVGIEVPNRESNVVHFRELIETNNFQSHRYRLAFALGKDISGQPVIVDLAKMPHLLIAGATGSGKSVCINTLIMSILYKYTPDEVKLIMIDPKVVELSIYNGIPYLMIPVVTEAKRAAGALNWAVAEMNDRYKKFAEAGVRDLQGYNKKIDADEEKLPQIVIIIDELADLMMVAQNEVEDSICRLAQLARACGIHLVIATQRPSVNVITGLIKANIPTRIAFAVSSGVDSRTILDSVGAEKLLGKGDMLYSAQDSSKPVRIQGAFISDDEVQKVVNSIVQKNGVPDYSKETMEKIEQVGLDATPKVKEERDEFFTEAGRLIIQENKASKGFLQRRFKIGFNRAARIIDQLHEAGVVGEDRGTKPREILLSAQEFEEIVKEEGKKSL